MFINYILLASANFIVSKYDSHAGNTRKDSYGSQGFLKNHNAPTSPDSFGDISLITLNAHIDKDTLEEKQKSHIIELFNTHHPTVFAIQTVSKELMEYISNGVRPHYSISATDFKNIDLRTRKEEYKPIFYDANVLEVITVKAFKGSSKNEHYATFSIFRHKETQSIFTIVNMDLFSADSKAIDTQVFNILANIEKTPYKDSPIFLMGTINVMSNKLRRAINSRYDNLIVRDFNNRALSKNTFHYHGFMNDGVQRDFIFFRDSAKSLKLNYSRILEAFDKESFEHYPIYSILSFSNRK